MMSSPLSSMRRATGRRPTAAAAIAVALAASALFASPAAAQTPSRLKGNSLVYTLAQSGGETAIYFGQDGAIYTLSRTPSGVFGYKFGRTQPACVSHDIPNPHKAGTRIRGTRCGTFAWSGDTLRLSATESRVMDTKASNEIHEHSLQVTSTGCSGTLAVTEPAIGFDVSYTIATCRLVAGRFSP